MFQGYSIYSEYSVTRKYSVSTDYSAFYFFPEKTTYFTHYSVESYLNIFEISLFEIKKDSSTADGRTLK